MDDLLALFEENPPEEPQPPATPDSDDESAVGDAARSATETTPGRGRGGVVVGPGAATKHRHDDSQTTNTQQQQKSSSNQHQHVSCTVDARVDIRMKNRKISSIDLLDMISSGGCHPPYHSPASLAAMSMAQLNRLLLEPAAVVDMATTVQGKANIMTVGIVFSNSATRIAASGNAFCIITIGTLRTGPAVSLLLFGGAYGQHVKPCKPGMVIAVFSPKLVPPKKHQGGGGDTAITFTLNDARQISILAESEDYATCQGRVRGKNEAGAWVSDAKPCRTVVDKRVCLYCPLHRCQQQQQNKNNVKSVAPTNKGQVGTIKMQALRLESTMASMQQHGLSERRMILPQNSIPQHHPMKHHQALQGKNPRSENMLAEFLARQSGHGGFSSSSLTSSSVSQNRLLFTSNHHHQRQVPAGPLKSVVGKSSLPPGQQAQKNNGNSILLNPYSKKQVTPDNSTTAMGGRMMGHATTMMMKPIVVAKQQLQLSTQSGNKSATSKLQDLQNILQPPPMKRGTTTSSSSSKATSNKRPRKTINTVSLEGFNGSVVVPKPKPIFAAASSAGRHLTISSNRTQQQLQQQQEAAVQALAIRAKQQQMAARLRENQQHQGSSAMQGGRNRQVEQHSMVASSRDSLFGTPLDDAQREQLLEAKSHFADEAKSEEYARSRKVVVELEKQEEKKNNQSGNNNNKNKNKANKDSAQAIQKQWHCTCGKSYPKRPRMCEQANHRVVLCREIQKQKSTSEKRFDLSNKDASDGGLKLGSGIEWSYSRFS